MRGMRSFCLLSPAFDFGHTSRLPWLLFFSQLNECRIKVIKLVSPTAFQPIFGDFPFLQNCRS